MMLSACHHRSGECIADRVEVARTFSKRLVGLMGRRTMTKGQGLYFPGCSSIHSFFMKFAIDILFLDKEMKITKIINGLKPYRMAFAPLRTQHTLELSCGVLSNHPLTVGDTIALIQKNDEDYDHNII